jgi:hypothetical protein
MPLRVLCKGSVRVRNKSAGWLGAGLAHAVGYDLGPGAR